MKDILHKIALALLPAVYFVLSRLWLSTCRLTVRGRENIDAVQDQGAMIALFWHYSIIYLFHHLRGYNAAVLVSASRGGDFVARIVRHFGMEAIRGSSNRQGAQALKQLLKAARDGKHIGIVADGSQGPARVLQPGAVFLASRTGVPIFPLVWAVDRCWAFNSWDMIVLPKPFSRIVFRYGKPITVPPDLDAQGIEKYRLKVEEELNTIYSQVWAEFGRPDHDGGQGRTRK